LTGTSTGWRFPTADDTDAAGENVVPDPVPGHEKFTHLRDVYFQANPQYEGRFTVPVLYDKKTQTIVNNESSEILRMFSTEFNDVIDEKYRAIDFYPDHLRAQIDETHEWQYDLINNGVYKSGFATTQQAYERAVVALFDALDRAEAWLEKTAAEGPYWFGQTITEVDIRL
jgi:putative glutathione S-transferase